MRKLFESVLIMVFCVGIASASKIIVISDTGYWPSGSSSAEFPDFNGDANYQDSQLVDFLKSLGHTVDTSGMAGNYRDRVRPYWYSDAGKLAALDNADLIIVSRKINTAEYRRKDVTWNQLAVPMICQCGNVIQYTTTYAYWGWCDGGTAQQTGESLQMDFFMDHDLVHGCDMPLTAFSTIPANPQNPEPIAEWDPLSMVIASYEGAPLIVDIPAGTNLDDLCGTTAGDKGITGARRIYMGIYTYDDSTWGEGLTDEYKALFANVVANATKPVKIVNSSPASQSTYVSVTYTDTEDLVFNVLDSNVTRADVYFGTDPNVIGDSQNKIIDQMVISTTGEYSVDLSTILTENMEFETDYYWAAMGYEPNTISGLLELTAMGPIWKFTTEPARPMLSAVSPAQNAVFEGDAEATFTVIGSNIETYQWYKQGVATPLANGSDYTGVDSDTLVILNVGEDDLGFYYCVGSKPGFTDATSDPAGELMFKELKHHFPFNVEDTVGLITPDVKGGLEGQLTGGASVECNEPNAIIGGYLQLDNGGSSDNEYMSILSSSFANYPDITITAWFLQGTRDLGCIFDIGEDEDNFFTFTPGYREDLVKTQFEYEVEGVQKQGEYEVNFDRTGGWHFVAITLDSIGISKTYIDGEFKASGDLRGNDVEEINLTSIDKSSNLIGKRIYPNLQNFDGFIDEVKVYNYVLNDVQIAEEYVAVMGGVICAEGYDLQDYDYDHNCRVDLMDFAEFSSKWLEHERFYRP